MAVNSRTEADARMNLQRYLRQLAYFDENIPFVPIDGNKGSNTTDAIRAFQSSRGLPATGVADQETWEAIYEEYLTSLEKRRRLRDFHPFRQSRVIMRCVSVTRDFPSRRFSICSARSRYFSRSVRSRSAVNSTMQRAMR